MHGCTKVWAHHRSKIIVEDCSCPNINIYKDQDEGISVTACQPAESGSPVLTFFFQHTAMIVLVIFMVGLMALKMQYNWRI
jgi:hypothetical protein